MLPAGLPPILDLPPRHRRDRQSALLSPLSTRDFAQSSGLDTFPAHSARLVVPLPGRRSFDRKENYRQRAVRNRICSATGGASRDIASLPWPSLLCKWTLPPTVTLTFAGT